MKRKPIIGIVLVLGLLIVAVLLLFSNTGAGLIAMIENAAEGDPPIPTANEVVMPPNSTIEATTTSGTVAVRSGGGLKRYYTWEGATRSVVMWPRVERWYGSLGMYYPGPGSHWMPRHNGISRGVLEEGQQQFANTEEAKAWIEQQARWYPIVYRDDGLLVAYGKTIVREQLDVGVWQIMIAGKKPEKLNGSNNGAIHASWDKKS